jgi:hypothetical protein
MTPTTDQPIKPAQFDADEFADDLAEVFRINRDAKKRRCK